MNAPTFSDFAALARREGWTKGFLRELCQPWYDDAAGGLGHEPLSSFLDRLLDPRRSAGARASFRLRETRANCVLPYRPLLELYARTLAPTLDDLRPCACGCGKGVLGRKKFASDTCRQRAHYVRKKDRGGSGRAVEPEILALGGGPMPDTIDLVRRSPWTRRVTHAD